MRGSSVRGERDSGGDRDNVPRRQPTMHLRDSHTVPCILETRTLYKGTCVCDLPGTSQDSIHSIVS